MTSLFHVFLSAVFVFVGVYFPAGDHCRSAGLHYLPRGKCTFCLECLGPFRSRDNHKFLHASNTTKSFSFFSILHQLCFSYFSPSKKLQRLQYLLFYSLCLLPCAFLSLHCLLTPLCLFLPFSWLQCFPFCYQVMHLSNIQKIRIEFRRLVFVCFKLGGDFCTGAVECYQGWKKLFLLLLMGGGFQMTRFFFPELSLKCSCCSHSWMRTSGRT